MSEARHDDEIKKAPTNPEVHAWILKEKDQKDLEARIVDTMRRLGSKLTKKEILALAQKIESSKWLDELKKSLEAESKLSKIPDEVLEEVYRLIQEAREITESGLRELRLQIGRVNPTKDYDIDAASYYSNRFPWVQKFERSELGEDVIIDIEGFFIWALDSAIGIVRLLLALIGDFFLLPKHAYEHFRQKKRP